MRNLEWIDGEAPCPECGAPQYCPCPACQKYIPAGIMPYHWVDGWHIACGECGFTQHADWWEWRAIEIYDKLREAEEVSG